MSGTAKVSPDHIWAVERALGVLTAWKVRECEKVKLSLPCDEVVAIQEIAAAILEGFNVAIKRGQDIAASAKLGAEPIGTDMLVLMTVSPSEACAEMVKKLGCEIAEYIGEQRA